MIRIAKNDAVGDEPMLYKRNTTYDHIISLSADKIYRFMMMAYQQGKFSKATKLKVGTLIVNPSLQIIGTGYNGTPIGTNNQCENPQTHKTYDYVIHSELNAVLNATTNNLKDCMVFVTDSPCIKCASVLVQKGITEVFYLRDYRLFDGVDYLIENGVGVTKLDVEKFDEFVKNFK